MPFITTGLAGKSHDRGKIMRVVFPRGPGKFKEGGGCSGLGYLNSGHRLGYLSG